MIDAGKGAGDGTSVGTVQYNRGIFAAMLAAEAARKAQEIAGTPDITPAQMRDGMEALTIDAARLEELGMTGFGPELTVTCANHRGPGVGLMTQWDAEAKTWVQLTDFIAADEDVIAAADRRGRRRLPRRDRGRAARVPGDLTPRPRPPGRGAP